MPKVLFIRFSSIGDIVLTTPVVRCIKQQLPGAMVHYITKKQFEPILKANPYIDKFWLYEGGFKDLMPRLRAERYDFIVDLHKNMRSAYVKFMLGGPSGSFTKLNIRKFLIVNFKWNFLPDIHIVDRYFKAAVKLGVKNDSKGLDYFIPSADEVVPAYPDYVAVVIGGKHNTKIFPPEKVAEVIKKLNKPVILLGGKEDRERGEQIVSLSSKVVLNACGQYSLNQAASLVRQSSAVLTNDTGLMHIAAAFRKKMVSVWGNTIPAFGMYPYLPAGSGGSCIAEIADLSCRPCSKIGFRECPRHHFRCMMDISVDDIVAHLE
ncbi:MAG: glycosyltransferase family 9 protein [Bacteroidetes bacterium]|nr:glycosyltransferase family 9 protein [Bacteroidota bacterium]